jgi:hypothetical protein
LQALGLPNKNEANMTECTTEKLIFEGVGRRRVEADFSGGQVSSDGGVLLVREADRRIGLSERMADCFVDYRDSKQIEHSVKEMIRQRIYALALGYEDVNDHELLSRDPLLATAIGKKDPQGQNRRNSKHQGVSAASASTLDGAWRSARHRDFAFRGGYQVHAWTDQLATSPGIGLVAAYLFRFTDMKI